MNKKVIDSKVTIIDESGIPHMMGTLNEPNRHVKYLLDYINLNFPNIDTSNLTFGNVGERFAYQIAMFGDITYFNERNFGMFYFPDELTDEQLETLENIDLGSKKVGICYNLKQVGDKIMYSPIGMGNDCTLKDAMEEYRSKRAIKHHRRWDLLCLMLMTIR